MWTCFPGAGDLLIRMTLIWADSGTRIGVQVVCLGGDVRALCEGVGKCAINWGERWASILQHLPLLGWELLREY